MSTSIAARTAAAARRACWLRCALVVLAARTPDSFFALRAFSELAALRAFARPALPPTFAPAFFFAAAPRDYQARRRQFPGRSTARRGISPGALAREGGDRPGRTRGKGEAEQ